MKRRCIIIHLPPLIFFIPIVPPVYNTNTLVSRKHFVPLTSIIATNHDVVYISISFSVTPAPAIASASNFNLSRVVSRGLFSHSNAIIYTFRFFPFFFFTFLIIHNTPQLILKSQSSWFRFLKEKNVHSRVKLNIRSIELPWTCVVWYPVWCGRFGGVTKA